MLLSADVFTVLFPISNFLHLVVTGGAFLILAKGNKKTIYLLLSTAIAFYTSSVLVYFSPWLGREVRVICGGATFAFAAAIAVLFHLFVIVSIRRPDYWRRPVCLILAAAWAALLLLLGAGQILQDVALVDGVIKTNYGPAQRLYVLVYILTGVYSFRTLWVGYKSATDDILRPQLLYTFWIGLITFVAGVVSNGILPAIYKSSLTSVLAPAWFMFMNIILLWILIEEPLIAMHYRKRHGVRLEEALEILKAKEGKLEQIIALLGKNED